MTFGPDDHVWAVEIHEGKEALEILGIQLTIGVDKCHIFSARHRHAYSECNSFPFPARVMKKAKRSGGIEDPRVTSIGTAIRDDDHLEGPFHPLQDGDDVRDRSG
jgi:hypothetical protein